MEQEILVWLVTLWKLRFKTCSQRGAFPLLCCLRAGMDGLNEIRTAINSKNIYLQQCYIVTYRKKLEKVLFVEEEFLQTNISNKDVYVDYGAMADIPEDAVKQYGDLTALK